MKRLMALLLASMSLSAVAQPSPHHFTLEPAQTVAGHTVNLRVDSDNGCYPANTFNVTRDGTTVTVNNLLSDTLPCEPQWQTPRIVELGSFEPGQYLVIVETCVNAPGNPCSVWANLPLTVFGASSMRFTVPTLTRLGAMGLMVLVLVVGWWVQRRG